MHNKLEMMFIYVNYSDCIIYKINLFVVCKEIIVYYAFFTCNEFYIGLNLQESRFLATG